MFNHILVVHCLSGMMQHFKKRSIQDESRNSARFLVKFAWREHSRRSKDGGQYALPGLFCPLFSCFLLLIWPLFDNVVKCFVVIWELTRFFFRNCLAEGTSIGNLLLCAGIKHNSWKFIVNLTSWTKWKRFNCCLLYYAQPLQDTLVACAFASARFSRHISIRNFAG